jgi:hypothetical protein
MYYRFMLDDNTIIQSLNRLPGEITRKKLGKFHRILGSKE